MGAVMGRARGRRKTPTRSSEAPPEQCLQPKRRPSFEQKKKTISNGAPPEQCLQPKRPSLKQKNKIISNGARIQQLRSDLAHCLQNGRSIAAYYGELNNLWDDLYNCLSLPYCSCGNCQCGWDTRLIKEREKEKTYKFLMGLDDVYNAVRSNLLAKHHPLPPPNWVYELLLQKETQLSMARLSRHLPEVLLPSILSRLPVKSLLRFRCVAKPWLDLVDNDAEFARLHFNTFNNKSSDKKNQLFVVENGNHCTVRCSETFQPISGGNLPFNPSIDGSLRWCFVSSVDGLVLIMLSRNRNIALKLWNPSIRKFRDVPPLPLIDDSMSEMVIGFGYDMLSKDYKIVKIIYLKTGELLSLAVCSIRASSWKMIPFQVKGSSCPDRRWHDWYSNCVYLNGCLYMFSKAPYNKSDWDLVSFDLSNHVLSCISMPDDGRIVGEKLVLIDGGSSLAVYSSYTSDESIWVLERETMNWRSRCPYSLVHTKLLYGKKNGDTLTLRTHTEGFSDETGQPKVLCRDEVALYCPEKHQYKILQEKKRSTAWSGINHVFVHADSLILHKSIL